ncbi:MAG: YfhO family protein, partial [Chloroflexota bacterium]
ATKNDSTPPGRFLSLSSLEFDPGDMPELKSAWEPQLPASEVYDAIVATKYKEMLSPNLPMVWGIPSVDGYDGGILPLRSYAEFAKNFGATGATTDGRLRHILKAVPPNEMLSLTNTQWIITDKLKDSWIDDVFYDLQFSETITPDRPLTLNRLPRFSADALGLVLAEGKNEGEVSVTLSDGVTVTQKFSGSGAVRVRWDRTSTINVITIRSSSSLTLRGATLIDEKAKAFQSLTLGSYRLVHSGDTKIYQNMNVLPRAFIISNPQLPITNYKSATVIKYEPEHIIIQAQSGTNGYLILTDTFYPGWVATVDGEQKEITQAFGLFRAVEIGAGTHTVEFKFEPMSLKVGATISIISILVFTILMIISLRVKTTKPA